MKYKINKNERTPAYLQLYKYIREDIVRKVYTYNSKLPSKRIVSEELGISTVTVEHAYELLCDEGYVEARERSGYFVIFRADDGFAVPVENDKYNFHKQIISHNEHSYPQFPFSVLAKTMRKVISDYGDDVMEKSPNSGCMELRVAIKTYLERNRGIYADVEQIIIGSGAEYLYGLIVELFGREQVFAIESPAYKKIEQVYKASDVSYEMLPLTHNGIDSEALLNTNASILHTTPYRSFPTGVTASASKRHEYIRWSNSDNRYIVEDDFESEFSISTKPEETLFALSEHDNVVYLNTFSKTISPALRIGYMVIPKCLVKTFQEKLGFYSCTVPTFEQYVLAELISSGDFERHINRVRRKMRKECR